MDAGKDQIFCQPSNATTLTGGVYSAGFFVPDIKTLVRVRHVYVRFRLVIFFLDEYGEV
jgi:hypothetical protein